MSFLKYFKIFSITDNTLNPTIIKPKKESIEIDKDLSMLFHINKTKPIIING